MSRPGTPPTTSMVTPSIWVCHCFGDTPLFFLMVLKGGHDRQNRCAILRGAIPTKRGTHMGLVLGV